MSRALNLNATQDEVRKACTTLGVAMTAIEALYPSGTRVVCQNAEGALALRKTLGSKLIEGSVTRAPRSVVASALR